MWEVRSLHCIQAFCHAAGFWIVPEWHTSELPIRKLSRDVPEELPGILNNS